MEAKILLVEDNTVQAKAAIKQLKALGYMVSWAADGKSAIKELSTTPFDVALLDLELPDMHGTKLCQWIKENDATKRICVLIVTAKDSLGEKVLGLEAGASDYLLKPYNEVELQARIRTCLRTQALQDELEEKNRKLEELIAEAEKLAITDALTGLYNRRHMVNVLEQEFNRVQRYEEPLSCLVIDVDHFKRVNDTMGHAIGDIVLKGIAGTLKKSLRTVDIIARWGGEEFVVLMPETNIKSAEGTAGRLLKNVSKARFMPLQKDPITISIGLSVTSEAKITSSDMLVDTADEALLRAKKNGRNRMEVYAEKKRKK
jgi:diguanylate cyclase (GGDEF)-like protein